MLREILGNIVLVLLGLFCLVVIFGVPVFIATYAFRLGMGW